LLFCGLFFILVGGGLAYLFPRHIYRRRSIAAAPVWLFGPYSFARSIGFCGWFVAGNFWQGQHEDHQDPAIFNVRFLRDRNLWAPDHPNIRVTLKGRAPGIGNAGRRALKLKKLPPASPPDYISA
jgi:hypothetical protein